MKNIIGLFMCSVLLFASCAEIKKTEKATVTFGANSHLVNCTSTVSIYLNGGYIGTLENSVDTIADCNETGCMTKQIAPGEHSYKIEIRGGCIKDVYGTFTVFENECKKILVDYLQIFNNQNECDKDVIISDAEYETAPNAAVSIVDMEISSDCLKIQFAASACSGDTWLVNLIDNGTIAESYPCQRTLRLSLENKEICSAVITKETSFNIEALQIEGNDKVLLNIAGQQLLYEY